MSSRKPPLDGCFIFRSSLQASQQAFTFPPELPSLTDLVPPEHWGKAVAIHELAPNLGFVTAPLLVRGLFEILLLAGCSGPMGSWSILTGLIFIFLGRGGDVKGEAPRLQGNAEHSWECLSFWMMTAFFIARSGPVSGLQHDAPLFWSASGDEPGIGKYALSLCQGGRILNALFFRLDDRQGGTQAGS